MWFRNAKLIDVYSDLMRQRDNNLYGMIVLLEVMITVSASTAACECDFSCMNRQKTNIWTSLSQLSLDDVLRICINGCELKHFDAEKKIKRWMDITNGVRHIQGYKGPSKKERLTMVKLLLVRVTPEHFILLVLKFIKYFFC